jgi:hypothetical protein
MNEQISLTSEVATRLGITAQRVRQLIKELDLRPRRIGGAICLTEDEIQQLENRNTLPGRKALNRTDK